MSKKKVVVSLDKEEVQNALLSAADIDMTDYVKDSALKLTNSKDGSVTITIDEVIDD